ncbi:MAG: hypothetical protein LBN21_11420 [Treponema sp.]|jgi:hypothetical protein|nr:hypothetical protein [Treponema sp.]
MFCFFFFILIPFILFAEDETGAILDVEELRSRIEGEAKQELISLTLGDSAVSLFMSGYWKGTLQGNYGVAFTPYGTQGTSPDSPVLFTQEADMTLSLWVRDRWFLEANFLDDYDINTYRAGYQGFSGEAIQYAGVGNTGLDFPVFPYLDLGGDSPSSFGVYGKFGGGPLQLHALFRYDAAAREERIFVGDRERTYAHVSPDYPLRGLSFVLPDSSIDTVPVVYLEDKDGDLRDTGGRRWRTALPSEFAAGAASGVIELNIRPPGMAAVSYRKNSALNPGKPWEDSIGAYDTPLSPGGEVIPGSGSGFLGEISRWFGQEIDISAYPQPGQNTAALGTQANVPGSVVINGVPALVLREGGSFSPFERLSRYEAPSSMSSGAFLVKLSNGERIAGFEALPLEDSAVSSDIPLYAVLETRRGFYEIINTNTSRDPRSPEALWPLAAEYPEIYLPGSGTFTGDITLRFTNYGGSGAYSIGTDVVPGSVQVYRSGIVDPRINYDTASGNVTLESPAGFNEVIRITYLKRSDETRFGSLAAGIGAVYNPDGPFSSSLALGLRWNVTADSYSEEGVSNPGTVGLGAKAAWDYDRLKAGLTLGLGFEQPDTAGLYRAAGMEGNEISLGLSRENSFISEAPDSNLTLDNRSPLSYRNYRDTGALANSGFMEIDWSGASLVPGQSGPYPARDSSLTTQANVLAAEFELDAANVWTGFELALGDDGALMEQAREIEIPFRFYDFNADPPPDFTLLLQIGALSDEDRGFSENPALIMAKQIYPPVSTASDPINNSNNPAAFGRESRLARIMLTDADRRKLRDAKYMRLMAVHSGVQTISGRILLAPPIVRGVGWRPVTVDGTAVIGPGETGGAGRVQAVETYETGTNRLQDRYGDVVSRLHSAGSPQRVLEVKWDTPVRGAGADGRIGALPLSNYRSLSFFVKGPAKDTSTPDTPEGFSDGILRFILARGPSSLDNDDEITLDAEIPLAELNPEKWSRVDIRYRGTDTGIWVDGRQAGGRLKYRPQIRSASETIGNETGKSAYLAVFAVPPPGSTLEPGRFFFDEVLLDESAPNYRLNGGGSVEYNRPGALVSVKGKPIIENLRASTAMESEIRGDPFIEQSDGSAGVAGRTIAEISVLGAQLQGNFSFTAVDDGFYWDGGHGIRRAWGPFSFRESFSSAPRDKSLDHRFGMELSGMFPVHFSAEAFYENEKFERMWDVSVGFAPPNKYIPSLSINAAAAWIENTAAPSEWDTYGEGWVQTWAPMIPDLGDRAARRNIRALVKISETTTPVGADLSVEGSAVFSKPNNTTQSASAVHLDIPVTIGAYRLVLQGERGFKQNLLFSGIDALEDGGKFVQGIADSLSLWGQAPLYSLFAQDMGSVLQAGLENSPSALLAEYSAFNDRAGFTLLLPQYYDIRAFFIPSSTGAQVGRVLEQKLDVPLDMLTINGNLGFSAINMFGAFGAMPVFSFYQSDEFTHALDGSAALPRGEDPSWRIQSGFSGYFRGFAGSELDFINTITAAAEGWLESLTLEWRAPTKRSLLSMFYGMIARAAQSQSSWLALSELLNANYEQFRKETLETVFDFSGDYLQWSITAGHESFIHILGRLNFSVFAKLSCTQNQQTKVLSFIGTAGTTLNVSF